VLDLIVAKRLRRRLTTVIDSTGLEEQRRNAWRSLAERHGVPAYAVFFDTPANVVRERNRALASPVPSKVVTGQLNESAGIAEKLEGEGFAGVHRAGPVALVPSAFLTAPDAAVRQKEDPVTLDFGLQVSRFGWPGHPATTAETLAEVAQAAEEAGFTSLWVMDHFLQIPQIGREWEDMLESHTTLGYLAGVTERIRLGTLVTGITYRNIAHLAKIVATLDVLSGGRALCGIGAAWFEREHRLYGWEFPPLRKRYELLEDALELLPLMWGRGAPSFEGRTLTVGQATCYPRPLQEHIPILVGGGGERRTLQLVARHADACNVFGDPGIVRRKIAILREHCAAEDRDPAEIEITQLSPARVVASAEPREGAGAATVEEHVGRYRELAESGVQTAIVGLSDAEGPGSVSRFAEVIAAFGGDD
jgi:F420-dependent oxidoreductase-like protein